MNRSHKTILPSLSAGIIFSTTCCLLLAAYNNASVLSSISVLFGSKIKERISSAIAIPPGSRVTKTSYPFVFNSFATS